LDNHEGHEEHEGRYSYYSIHGFANSVSSVISVVKIVFLSPNNKREISVTNYLFQTTKKLTLRALRVLRG
jgi:hypothetical protein